MDLADRLHRATTLHETVVSVLREGIVVQDRDLRIVASNERAEELLGLTKDQMAGRTSLDPRWQAVHDDGTPWPGDTHPAVVALRTGEPQLDRVMGIHTPDGRLRWLLVSAQPLVVDEVVDGVVVSIVDVTERRRHEERLQHLADHDPLTGLLNRRGFQRALEQHLAHVRRSGPSGALLVLDVDHPKYVNDRFGHAVGDQLVVALADVVRATVRGTDVVGRLGGDEFAVLTPTGGRREAEALAGRVLAAVRDAAPLPAVRQAVRSTVSVGVAPCRADGAGIDELLVNADLAMYDAKEAGRDRFAVYSGEGDAEPQVKARITWAERLREALDQDRLTLLAQPIVDLREGGTPMHELLLRMVSADGDLIPPGAFLATAERFDLVLDLDRWVVAQACALLGAARDAGRPASLSVNVSARSLAGDALLEHVDTCLLRSGVDPASLTFEITETAAVGRIHDARLFARGLQDLGCRLAIDDFGAGFGSFYYLKHLPFDFLKIDGEFVVHAQSNRADDLIVDAVRDLAHGLGRQVIAEFVSDASIEHHLRGKGIDLGQGYHLGRPVDAHQALGLPPGQVRAAPLED